MNIPSTKEETDLVLFDLLEGNLTKKEEEFWYDYSLKNKDFATQLELFRKIYMKDDMVSYPDLSQILRKSPWYMMLKWQLALSAGVAAIGLSIFFFTPEKVIPTVNKPAINKTIEVSKVIIQEKASKVVTKPIVNSSTVNSSKKLPQANQNLIQKEPAKILKSEPQQIISSHPVAVKDTVISNKEEKIVEKKQEPKKQEESVKDVTKETTEIKKQQRIESPKVKDKKDTPLKIKVKTSKKTKTSDFNY